MLRVLVPHHLQLVAFFNVFAPADQGLWASLCLYPWYMWHTHCLS